jgi:hypothetical protein
MIAKHPVLIAATSMLALSLSPHVFARPVTPADLSGRKICWESDDLGSTESTYSANGAYTNTLFGNGTWNITANGVHVVATQGEFTYNLDKGSGGIFKSTTTYLGKTFEETGKYCR